MNLTNLTEEERLAVEELNRKQIEANCFTNIGEKEILEAMKAMKGAKS